MIAFFEKVVYYNTCVTMFVYKQTEINETVTGDHTTTNKCGLLVADETIYNIDD